MTEKAEAKRRRWYSRPGTYLFGVITEPGALHHIRAVIRPQIELQPGTGLVALGGGEILFAKSGIEP